MQENRGLSSSEQYVKKSNRKLLFGGILLLLVFFIALAFISNKSSHQEVQPNIDFVDTTVPGIDDQDSSVNVFARGNAQLKVVPEQIDMNNVVIGSQVEATINLTAENTPIIYKGASFVNEQQDGFAIETTCKNDESLPVGSGCLIKVLWNPVSLRQLQNILTIEWKEDSQTSFEIKKTTVQVKAQSTDSKDCVICETVSKEDAVKEQKYAMGPDGTLYPVNEDGSIVIDGEVIKPTKDGLYINSKGEIVAVAVPEKIPLNLNNEVMGKIAPNGDVISAEGEKLGRLLGDDTIVDTNLKVLGAAVPVVSAMDMNGIIIGKMLNDGTVVNAQGSVIGKPLANGSIANLSNTVIGFLRPWGLVSNLNGKVIGAIIPDGTVLDAKQTVIGSIKPNGLAVSPTNDLIGGTIPMGVVVAPGCQTVGRVLQNGDIKDSYDQTVGKVLIDGSAINSEGADIGAVVPLGLVLNEKGETVGFVNSEGKAVGPKGNVIGCVNTDGSVSAGKKSVGGVMPKGRVIGYGCQQVGATFPDGSVINDNVISIGKVMTDSYVKDATNKIIGVVIPRASAIADGCRLLGLISVSGNITDISNNIVGCMTPDKTVINREGKTIGALAIKGIVVNKDGNVIGRVRLDGKVMDLQGKIIGCLQEDGSVISIETGEVIGHAINTGTNASNSGVILDANGNPTGWTIVGNKVYDANGNEIGTIDADGIVSAANGKFLGVIPPDGVIFSPDGMILGRYNSKTGYAVNNDGDRFGRVLPELTVISGETSQIIGALIANNTGFMDADNTYLATMAVDGTLKNKNNEVIGAIRANRTVTNKEGKILGYQIPKGKILSVYGKEIGSVSDTGEVISLKKSPIGKILPNGIAISTDNKILGGVFKRLAVAMGPEELLGYPSVTGAIMDKNGSVIAQATPFGIAISDDGVVGRMLPFGTYLNHQNKLVGWTSFDADLTGITGRSIGRLTANGLALDKTGEQLGYIAKTGVAVNTTGRFFGYMSIDNSIQTEKGKGSLYASDYIYNNMDEAIARILPVGVGVDTNGKFAGWLKENGTVGTEKETLGYVWNDYRIVNAKGDIKGTFIPLNSIAYTDYTKNAWFINETAQVATPKGQIKGSIVAPETVMSEGSIIAKLTDKDLFVADLVAPKVSSITSATGETLQIGTQKPTGSIMLSSYAAGLNKQIQGAAIPQGAAVSNSLNSIGREIMNGSVLLRGKKEATTSGTRALYDEKDSVRGMILPISTFIGKTGLLLGQSPAASSIINMDGKTIAVQMPLGFALSSENLWAGGKVPFGMAVDDDANILGTVAADGAVIGKSGQMIARALSDGAVADIQDRSLYNVMPYKGGIVAQGLAFSYRGKILGRTTLAGDILDESDNKTFRILDDGTILGKEEPLVGAILPFYTAISQEGEFMGTLAGNGQILSPTGELRGKIAVNATVKQSEFKITGALIPQTLITNDCKVVGQAAFNGQVIDAKGTVLGRIMPDKWALSPSGEKIGRVTRVGIVISNEGSYLGRTMPDSTVVDTSGVNIGCSRNDGSVVDHRTGEVIGRTLERGLVLGKDGKPIGRVKADGTVVNAAGEVIGRVLADGTVVDKDGKVIGRMISRDEEILYDENGNIKGTFSADGTFRDKEGNVVFRVDKDGNIYDKNGNLIGRLDEDGNFTTLTGEKIPGGELTVLMDKDGNVIGIVSGCDVINPQNEKIGTISADGSVVDLNGNIFAYILGNGTILDKDRNELGKVSGTSVKLDRCGIKTLTDEELMALEKQGLDAASKYGRGISGKGIVIGGQAYKVSEKGEILDDEGMIIGYMENGKPYTIDHRLITASGDSQGRIRPSIIEKRMKPSKEQIQQMQEILSQKRESMSAGMQSKGLITPNKRIQAMGRKKADANWDSIGIQKIVSSYPVDMSRMILKDKAIPAVLVRSIDSRYANMPVTAIVERHIYSEKGRNIIIPAGSRLIGTFAGEQGTDKRVAKLEITWQRLIRPDGGAFTFEATSGDAQGRGGIAAYLDDQLVQKFGKPIMTSVVTSAISYMMATNDDMYQDQYGNTITSSKTEAANDARENFINSMQTIFDQLVADAANIPVVIFVPSGTRLTVFANEDLWLRSEEDDIEEAGETSTEIEKPETPSWVEKRSDSSEEDEGEELEEEGEEENESQETSSQGDEKYYKPIDKAPDVEAEESTPVEEDSVKDNEPVYKADTVEKKSIKERKAAPVLPKTGATDKLF
ncbi:MAG: DUF3659 domain-containing protein [Alphaproteobacteria bacterium]|nr:DUF3659 domain-containing protein [Alphaproteobacteria bacterium]